MPVALLRSALFAELSLNAEKEPPREFRLFKAGINETSKGNFLFSSSSQQSCMMAFEDHGVDLSIDYDHGMFASRNSLFGGPADPAESGKAAGWFKPELRNGELWAVNVDWTPPAKQKLMNKEFRYISAAFSHTEDGTIDELLNCALTNIPAMKNAPALMHRTPAAPKDSAAMKTLLALLSLPLDSNEDVAAKAITTLSAERAALLTATGCSSVVDAIAKVEAWKAAAAAHTELSRKVAEAEANTRTVTVKAMLDAAVKDGKVAPAETDFLSEMGLKEPEKLKAYLDAKPKLMAKPAVEPKEGGGGVATLSAEERAVAAQMGFDTTKLAESKAKLGTSIPVVRVESGAAQ